MSVPESITINGVTISREQFRAVRDYQPKQTVLTWEAFVAANTQPEHYDGEPCTLPVCELDIKRAGGFRFEYTGEYKSSPERESWVAVEGYIVWGCSVNRYWILRAVPIKPAPEYQVGDWVVPLDWKPRQIDRIDFDGHDYYYHVPDGPSFTDASLRPATREDFMTEFEGTKWWIQGSIAYFKGRNGGINHIQLTEAVSLIFYAAGVRDMPEEFWK